MHRLLTITLLVIPLFCQGTSILSIGPGFDSLRLDDKLSVAVGDSITSLYKPYTKPRYRTGFGKQTHWLRFGLYGTDSLRNDLVIEFANPFIEEFQVHLTRTKEGPGPGASISSESFPVTGADFRYRERPADYRFFHFPFSIEPGERIDFLVRIENRGQNRIIPMNLWSSDRLHKDKEVRSIYLSSYMGMVGLIIVYGFIILYVAKTDVRWYYLSYLFLGSVLIACYTGLAFQFVWPFSTYLHEISVPLFSNLALLSAFLLVQRLFRLRQFYPIINRWLDLLVLFLIAAIAGTFFIPFFPEGLLIFNRVTNDALIAISAATFIVVPLIIFFINRQPDPIYFFLAIVLNAASVIQGSLENMDLIQLRIGPEPFLWLGLITVNIALTLIVLSRVRKSVTRSASLAEDMALRQKSNMFTLLQREALLRRRISEEISDKIGMRIRSIDERMRSMSRRVQEPALKQGLLRTIDALVESGKALSGIASNRIPSNLLELGLLGAIKEIAQPIEQSGTKVELRHPQKKMVESLDLIYQFTIFRIVQGLLNNVFKHAAAKRVSINFKLADQSLELIITDDGAGFSDKDPHGGRGLNIIKKRVESLGGTLMIDSKPRIGSRCEIQMPIKF